MQGRRDFAAGRHQAHLSRERPLRPVRSEALSVALQGEAGRALAHGQVSSDDSPLKILIVEDYLLVQEVLGALVRSVLTTHRMLRY